MTDADLLDALRDCYDARTRRNVVELGLVRSARVERDTEAPGANIRGVPARFIVHVDLYAPAADETANTMLQAQIANRLAGLQSVSRAEIAFAPPLFPIL